MTLETLFQTYHDEIYRYLWRITQDDALAQDLSQETFLKALRSLATLPPESNYRAWLYRIATNTHHDHWRRLKRRPTAALDLDLLASREDIEGDYAQRELLRWMADSISKLPPKQQQVLILSRYQGLSYPEISTVLEISAEAVRANVYLALKKLQSMMQEEA